MLKILVVFGTRPEAIKLIPVIEELKKHPDRIETKICVTSQHRQMLDQVLDLFGIKPDFNLDIMQENQNLQAVTALIIQRLKQVIDELKPDWLLVQGDTTTTFVSSLAGFYSGIKVAHVEAGLRTWNKKEPFPEEINRVLTSRIADVHFAPTAAAKDNLVSEGIKPDSIWVTGNTVVDALQMILNRINEKAVSSVFEFINNDKKVILVTGHRRESFGKKLQNICAALKEIARNHSDVEIVYPVHLNPNVWKPVHEVLGNIRNIHLIEPLDYLTFVYLMNRSSLIITDSGGIQEEAPSLGKYVLVTRDCTERPEGVEAGVAKLVGNSKEKICLECENALIGNAVTLHEVKKRNPYGDGMASKRIAEIFLKGTCNEFIRE